MVTEGHTTYQIGVVSWGIGTIIFNFMMTIEFNIKEKKLCIFLMIVSTGCGQTRYPGVYTR